MTIAIQTPFRDKKSVELSGGLRLFRKQVLPKRSINYKGRTITFDDQYLADLAQSFDDRAFDQVPFQLAGDDNSHTLDPERTRGEVKAFEVTADGLDAIVQLSESGAEVVRANPKLGVSARIVEGLERADGKSFGRAIQHVLGTLDPRVNNLKPWEAIALSNDDLTVVDLSTEQYSKKEALVPTDDKKLSAERRAELDKRFAEEAAYAAELASLKPAEQPDPAKLAADAKAKAAAEAAGTDVDAELEALLNDALAGDGAQLSNDAAGIDLINATLASQQNALAETQAELDLARYEREKDELVNAGVPPAMVDLAMPLLLGKDKTIDLSNGSTVDAGEIVRKLLAESKGTVDLSKETVAAPGSPASDKTGSMLNTWEQQHPSAITATGAYAKS